MRTPGLTLFCCTLLASPFTAAQVSDADRRLCQLQGREVALQAAETLLPALDRSERQALAGLTEAVCLEYAPLQAPSASAAPEVSDTEEKTAQSGFSGWFDDIQVIAPEDRVRRPGLKRP